MTISKHDKYLVKISIIATIFIIVGLFVAYQINNRETITQTIDKKGIPFTYYHENSIGMQRNPCSISQKALFEYWDKYEKGDEKSKEKFLNIADWLVLNLVDYGDCSVWEYKFPWKNYDLLPPWKSALAQGQGLQTLIRAYDITGKKVYKDSAEQVLESFFIEIKNGGVTIKESDEQWWYEEYVNENGKESRVLNGMISALLGIHEYYERTKDPKANIIFEKGLASLRKNLHIYDSGEYTYYDQLKKVASYDYHKAHVNLLYDIYAITGDPYFKEYYDKYKIYNNNYDSIVVKGRIMNFIVIAIVLAFMPLIIFFDAKSISICRKMFIERKNK